MHKFFTKEVDGQRALIHGDDVKHAWKVLRMKEGDQVLVNDLAGQDYLGQVRHINKEEVVITLIEKKEAENESPLDITVFQGLPKGQKMDLICQKLTELGCNKLVPLNTERVIPALKNEFKKLDRLRRISLEAAKQSKRSRLMEISEVLEFSDLLARVSEFDLVLLPYEEDQGRGLKDYEDLVLKSTSIAMVVGPEGGFEEHEVQSLERAGAKVISLGPRILRTETCALSLTSMLGYVAGDMGGKNV